MEAELVFNDLSITTAPTTEVARAWLTDMMEAVADLIHERAKKFYFQYGFHELNAQSLTLFIPTKTIVAMMAPN